MKDYIVQLKIKNGYLLRMMRDRGFSVEHFSKMSGVHKTEIYNALNLKRPALRKDGQFTSASKRMARALGVTVWDIYPPQHLDVPLEKNTGETEMSLDDVQAIAQDGPDKLVQLTEAKTLIESALGSIGERNADMVRLYYGIDCDPLTGPEIAERYGLSIGRVMQLIHRAERYLKRPSRGLRDAFDATCR